MTTNQERALVDHVAHELFSCFEFALASLQETEGISEDEALQEIRGVADCLVGGQLCPIIRGMIAASRAIQKGDDGAAILLKAALYYHYEVLPELN